MPRGERFSPLVFSNEKAEQAEPLLVFVESKPIAKPDTRASV